MDLLHTRQYFFILSHCLRQFEIHGKWLEDQGRRCSYSFHVFKAQCLILFLLWNWIVVFAVVQCSFFLCEYMCNSYCLYYLNVIWGLPLLLMSKFPMVSVKGLGLQLRARKDSYPLPLDTKERYIIHSYHCAKHTLQVADSPNCRFSQKHLRIKFFIISLNELTADIIPLNLSHIIEQQQYVVFFPSHLFHDVICELSPFPNMFKERIWKKKNSFTNQTNFATLKHFILILMFQ